ncbi:TPA: HAMP domain-containing protein [Stenotrophomonas maltophilia]|uniref:ATP-binding protein n=1 Tax=Stenotrophomonas TaxID=40323 RepID=UPI000788860E|nr:MULTISPECIES: ATP-binding protein [Stenotrophomonas]MCV4212240.1 ATP-binding protein [Pseudomonas cichorii]SSM90040.1 sensory histidine kinase in two-component regulatory system with RstA [Acinetobacter baumannii]KYK39075.1 histidine kinase [Stenotrophomonas maltophilia]MBA0237566.1 HAMP domain-containing protein [Stenotrophomonas maltophilia]MBH1426702.1 HAMP domain-containing protein [Stenotrophomonas maltophilia]
MKRTPSAMRGHAFHFLRYGIGFLVAHLLLIVLGLWAWDALLEDRTEAGLLAEMRGTHALLQHRFAETPREQWPTLARELDADFAYALRMVPLAEAMKALPASQRPPFSNGRVQIDLEHMRSLQRIGDSDYAVMLGPLDEALPDEGWQDSEVSGVAILLLILMVAVALPMYVMVYRLWRDVSQLAQAARQMRDGQLDTRAPRAGTALVRPLANAFNHMAEQLQQLLESQRVLAQAVAHEVRTPLARMRFGLADLEDTALDEIQRDALGGLRTDVDRLQHLTDAGVEYAALGRCHQLTRQRLQLAALVRGVVAQFAPLPMPIQQMLSPAGLVNVNRHMLELALRNLLGNALRYARRQIRIASTVNDGWLCLQVEDDGPGIAPELRGQVLQPYVRLDPGSPGFGLGLALVQVVADKHGGQVEVTDSELGGACIRLHLPLESGAAVECDAAC